MMKCTFFLQNYKIEICKVLCRLCVIMTKLVIPLLKNPSLYYNVGIIGNCFHTRQIYIYSLITLGLFEFVRRSTFRVIFN